MKKLIVLLVVLALLFVGVSAFAGTDRGKAGDGDGKITVATITYTTEIEWFYILEQNYKAVADELDMELIQVDPDANPQTQVDMIEQMTQRGVDAILISPVDPQVIKAAVEELSLIHISEPTRPY